ncbi:hypothetical protein Bca101_054622 [Brassica carinata]
MGHSYHLFYYSREICARAGEEEGREISRLFEAYLHKVFDFTDHSFCTSLVPERLRVFVIRRILSLWLL